VKQIWEQTNLENLVHFIIAFVEKLIEVVRKRKIITKNDSYLPKMVNSYVFTEDRFTIFSTCESPSLAVEAVNSWCLPG